MEELAGTKPTSLLRWKAGETKTRVLCIALALICGTVFLAYMQKICNTYHTNPSKAFGDFFALWSYGNIAGTHPATDLYHFSVLHARQVALGMMPIAENPFPYPPSAIILFLPLKFFSYKIAYFVWIGVTLSLYVWAVVGTCWRSAGVILPVLIAPTTTLMIDSGQSGFLSGALLIGGVRLAESRPVVSGILFGILTFKPQLGVLVPVALIAAGLWRTLAAACATALALAAISTVSFGWGVWPAWVTMLPAYAHWFDKSDCILKFMPTVAANLRMLGVKATLAGYAQIVVALGVAVVIWKSFRTGPSESAAEVLLVGTLLCTPHALVYDTPMLTGALALFVGVRIRADADFSLGEVGVMLLMLMFPLLMTLKGFDIPISTLVLLLMMKVIVASPHAARSPVWLCALPFGSRDFLRGWRDGVHARYGRWTRLAP